MSFPASDDEFFPEDTEEYKREQLRKSLHRDPNDPDNPNWNDAAEGDEESDSI
jgi:hypothetical protein